MRHTLSLSLIRAFVVWQGSRAYKITSLAVQTKTLSLPIIQTLSLPIIQTLSLPIKRTSPFSMSSLFPTTSMVVSMSSLFHPTPSTVFFPQNFNLRSTTVFPLTLPPRVGPILAGKNWRFIYRKGNREPKKQKQTTKKEEEKRIRGIQKRQKGAQDAKIAKQDRERLSRDIANILSQMDWGNMSMSKEEYDGFLNELKKGLRKSYHEERKKTGDEQGEN